MVHAKAYCSEGGGSNTNSAYLFMTLYKSLSFGYFVLFFETRKEVVNFSRWKKGAVHEISSILSLNEKTYYFPKILAMS